MILCEDENDLAMVVSQYDAYDFCVRKPAMAYRTARNKERVMIFVAEGDKIAVEKYEVK